MKLLPFFAIGAYAGVVDKPNGNGSGCTQAGLDDAVRAGMPDGSRFEDYIVRHRKSATNKRVDFGTAHCKAAPWQGSNNPYNHVHDPDLVANFVDSIADNEARDAFILANDGTETFPAKSGGFFYCNENDGNWVQSKDMTACPDTSVQGSWEDHGSSSGNCLRFGEEGSASTWAGHSPYVGYGTGINEKKGPVTLFNDNGRGPQEFRFQTTSYGGMQWIGWRTEIYANHNVRVTMDVKWNGSKPNRGGNYGMKFYGAVISDWINDAPIDEWYSVDLPHSMAPYGDGYHIILIMDGNAVDFEFRNLMICDEGLQ